MTDDVFKEMLAEDIETIFLDPEEFGEIHTLDYLEYNMVVDNEQLQEWNATKLNGILFPDQDLEKGEVYIFIAAAIYEEPEIGQVIRYDNKIYRVLWTMTDHGMRHIVLGGYDE